MIEDEDSNFLPGPDAEKPAGSGSHEARVDPDALLEHQLVEATAAALPRAASLRAVVEKHGPLLRKLVMAENDWGKAQAFVEERLGRRVNLPSLRTYMSDLFPQKDLLRESVPQPTPAPHKAAPDAACTETVRQPQPQPNPSTPRNGTAQNPFAPRAPR